VNVREVLNELMGLACFAFAVGLLLAAKPLGLSDAVAGPAVGGLFVAAGLCYVAAAIDRRPRQPSEGGGTVPPALKRPPE
jgi:hypothetical protein